MTEIAELKPCPFCGGENPFLLTPTCTQRDPYNAADRAFPVIRCLCCFTEVPGKNWDHKGKTAVEAWNRRVIHKVQRELPPLVIEEA